MKALIHYPSMDEAPIGIWWVDLLTNKAMSHYDDPDSPDATRGRMVVMMKSTTNKPWEQWFDYLAQRAPYFVSWESIEILDQSPEEVLAELQKTAKAA